MNLRKLHYSSGIVIALFISAHLLNHLFSLAGPDAHIALMENFRLVYRNVFVEGIILLAVLVQIFSGIRLFLKRRRAASGFFEKLQLRSGLYLAFFFIVHVGAVLSGRLFLNLDTNFYFGAAGLNTFPLNLFFVPYYGLAIIAFFGHLSAIHAGKMKVVLFGIEPNQQAYGILFVGVLLAVVTLYGMTDGFTGYPIPDAYQILDS